MSGSSDMAKCPECGGDMNTYSDYKPFDTVAGDCLECGFYYYTETGQSALEGVNELRKEYELEPLKELKPKTAKV